MVVVGLSEKNNTNPEHKWVFCCSCGSQFIDFPSRVLSGHKKSCGCRKIKRITTHGVGKSPYYHTWWAMMQRCYNENHQNYSRYGARGISVCEEWHDPTNFVAWANSTCGEKKTGFTLDRKDNSKGYSPDNCKWSTASQQQNNRRNTLYVDFNGEKVPVSELARRYNVPVSRLRARIFEYGWPVEDAINTPKISEPFRSH